MARGRAQEVSGQHDEALSGYRELEDLGRKTQDAVLEMAALVPMITIHSTLSGRPDADMARTLSARSLVLAQELGDHSSEAKTLWNNLLLEILAADDYYKAIEFGERSLEIARQYDLKEQLAFTLQDLARAYVAVERFPEAKVAVDGAREYWRATGNMTMLADNLFNAAGVLYAQLDFDGAWDFVQEGLEISRSIGSVHLEVIALADSVQYHMNSGEIGRALGATEEGLKKLNEIVGSDFITAYLLAIAATVYGLIGMGDAAIEKALLATNLIDPRRRWSFNAPLALGYTITGRLPEAEETLQTLYQQPRFESKRHLDYFGIITPMADLVRGEFLLAKKEYQQILDYDLSAHGLTGNMPASLVLPDLLRIKGQALAALGHTREASETLVGALEMAEARSSKLSIWRILFELSEVAALENRHEDSDQLLQRSREMIDYLTARCGNDEAREGFLDHPAVRRALGGE